MKNKKTIEAFDKSFTIEKNLDKVVGGDGLTSRDRVVRATTYSGEITKADDSAEKEIVYNNDSGY